MAPRDVVLVRQQGHVSTTSINRPERRNALANEIAENAPLAVAGMKASIGKIMKARFVCSQTIEESQATEQAVRST